MIESEVTVNIEGQSDTYYLTDEEAKFKFMTSLKTGVWYIDTQNNGFVATIIADKVDDLPAIMRRAAFEKNRLKVAKKLTALLSRKKDQGSSPTVKDIMTAITQGIKA